MQMLHQVSGFIDTDKIHPDACPALVADLSVGEHGIIALAFGGYMLLKFVNCFSLQNIQILWLTYPF